MKKYEFQFTGRENGAIGRIDNFYHLFVKAETPHEAKLKLYDTHEHISVKKCTEYDGTEIKQIEAI